MSKTKVKKTRVDGHTPSYHTGREAPESKPVSVGATPASINPLAPTAVPVDADEFRPESRILKLDSFRKRLIQRWVELGTPEPTDIDTMELRLNGVIGDYLGACTSAPAEEIVEAIAKRRNGITYGHSRGFATSDLANLIGRGMLPEDSDSYPPRAPVFAVDLTEEEAGRLNFNAVAFSAADFGPLARQELGEYFLSHEDYDDEDWD